MRRYLWTMTLVLVLAMPLLAACGGDGDDDADPTATSQSGQAATEPSGSSPEPTKAAEPAKGSGDNILRVHQLYYPGNIDPHQISFTEEIAVTLLNYEGLTTFDAEMATVPAAAESWEYNDDATQVTFTLRDGLTYSDGSPLVAERFRYAIERTCNPNVAGPYQGILFVVAGCAELAETDATDQAAYDAAIASLGVEATDDRTLVVDLVQPTPYFHTIAALWVLFPVKQESIEQGGENWWGQPELQVGNGPFQINRIEEEQLITFTANANYWAGPPALDGFEYIYQPDSSVAVEAYRAGQVDIVLLDPTQFAAVRADASLSDQYKTHAWASTDYLTFNLTVEPFDDPKVREAFAYAYDRETWCNDVLDGYCAPAYSLIPPGVPGAIETEAFAFDPDAARQALADSTYGGPDNLPEITLTYVSDDPAQLPRWEWLAGHFSEILGIEVKLEGMEQTVWVDKLYDPSTRPQMTFLGWFGDYPDPQNWLSTMYTCHGVESAAGYCSEEFDALTTQADSSLDETTRLDLYRQAGELLVADQPVVFVGTTVGHYLVKPEVSGYVGTPGDLEWPGQRSSMMTITKGD